MNADSPNATAAGTIRLLWNGPMLYALVEVTGDSTPSDSATPNWNAASYRPTTDGLVVSMDVFNDQWGIETDTQGIFFMGTNPTLDSVTSYVNRGIPSLGSFFNPDNQDYCPRLAAFKSSGYKPGSPVNYTYEFALQIEGWGDEWNRELKNGTRIGLDVGIVDQGNSFTYLSRSLAYGGRERPPTSPTPNASATATGASSPSMAGTAKPPSPTAAGATMKTSASGIPKAIPGVAATAAPPAIAATPAPSGPPNPKPA